MSRISRGKFRHLRNQFQVASHALLKENWITAGKLILEALDKSELSRQRLIRSIRGPKDEPGI